MSSDYGNYQHRPIEGATTPPELKPESKRLSMRITRVASSSFEELKGVACGRERTASLARALDNSKVLADYFTHKITGKSSSRPSSARSSHESDSGEVVSEEETPKPVEKRALTQLEKDLEKLIEKIENQTEEMADPNFRNDLLSILKGHP